MSKATDKGVQLPGDKPGLLPGLPGSGMGDRVKPEPPPTGPLVSFDVQFLNATRATIRVSNISANGATVILALQNALRKLADDPQLTGWPNDTIGIVVHGLFVESGSFADTVKSD